jgi:hypothetical protein
MESGVPDSGRLRPEMGTSRYHFVAPPHPKQIIVVPEGSLGTFNYFS